MEFDGEKNIMISFLIDVKFLLPSRNQSEFWELRVKQIYKSY